MSTPRYVGVDVASARGSAYALLDADGVMHANGWLAGADDLVQLVQELRTRCDDVHVGIDSPRGPLPQPRSWAPRRGRWVRATTACGRHCELVVRALGLANPQWTPSRAKAPAWMKLGFGMFESLARIDGVHLHEVFPSASYTMLDENEGAAVSISLAGFSPGPKDMLDAVVAAFTVREYVEGRGCHVGGGDGLGTIVLPRPLTTEHERHFTVEWPS